MDHKKLLHLNLSAFVNDAASVSGIIYLCTLGVFGIGYIYDFWTLNDQITVINGST